jgi:hypothetical protein
MNYQLIQLSKKLNKVKTTVMLQNDNTRTYATDPLLNHSSFPKRLVAHQEASQVLIAILARCTSSLSGFSFFNHSPASKSNLKAQLKHMFVLGLVFAQK